MCMMWFILKNTHYIQIFIFKKWPNFNSSTNPDGTMTTEICFIIVGPHVTDSGKIPKLSKLLP